MKAEFNARVVAESEDIVDNGGYAYFPASAVRLDWMEKSPKTENDLKCPHGVQFYDVVVDGRRAVRGAWSYEAPLPRMAEVGGRFGFWEDVSVG